MIKMALKKGDFIEIEYTGKLKDENIVFDTTNEQTAKDNNIYEKQAEYKPMIVCLGENHLIKGLNTRLEGKEIGKEYTFDIPAEEAFGKKSAKLLRLVPMSSFKKHNIMPQIGLQVSIDGANGVIKTVTGGRIIVDFNHPLASHDTIYIVKINRIVEDKKEQISALIRLSTGIKSSDFTIEELEGKFTIKLNKKFNLPQQITDEISENMEKLTGEKVSFK